MDPPLPGGLKPQVGGPFWFSAAGTRSTVDQVVSTRPAGGLVLSQAGPGPGPGRDGRAGGHAPWSCHPGCGLVGGPGAWSWVRLVVVLDRPGCRLALVGGSLLLVRACFRCRTPSDLHVCMLTDILGVNRGCCGDFFLVVFGLVGGCFGVSRPSNWLDVSVTGLRGHYHGTRSGHIRPPGGRSQPLHPGQGERPDRGPDHCRGSAQGETHPAEGATPTQGPRSYGGPAIPPREVPLRWLGRPHGLRGQRPLTGPCHRSQEEEMAWDDGAGIDAGCWSERRIPPPRR